jgi:DNA-binding response OmpR family regulator
MNFLYVDDNRLLLRFLEKYLRGKGHQCAILHDTSKVINWLAMNSCDAVILDIGMPKMNGIELAALIRRSGYPDLPIIIFTSLGYDEESMTSCRKAGCNGYVSKGLGPSEIYGALMRVLENTALK